MNYEGQPPFIPVAEPVIGERELAFVMDAVKSTWISSLGEYLERFEREFAAYVGVPYGIAVSNGTTGLHLALHALGLGPGDEVIIPDLTFVATAHAVLQTGATPVLVDVEPDTWCIDPRVVERAITNRTKAIVPVHLFGHPADMDSLVQIAQAHNLSVVEDCAEAHGAEIRGQRVGSLGHMGVFSFYGNKIITTGEGGMITTSDPELAARLRFLKDHGMKPGRRYFHDELAFNYRMTNIQAALGVAQLAQIEPFIARKRQISGWYRENLADVCGLRFHVERPGTRNVYWMACIVLEDGCPVSCENLSQGLRDCGIDTRPFFVPLHQLPHLEHCARLTTLAQDCPESSWLSQRGLNLPSSCKLDEATVRWIADRVRAIVFGQAH